MKNSVKWLLGLALLAAALGTTLLLQNREGFTGSRVKNPDAYLLDIRRMNGTDLHALELQEGDCLDIHFETVQGTLYMEIKGSDGSSVYAGNGRETKNFTVNISQSGVYTIVVAARHAKGNISVQCKEEGI